MNSPKQLPIPPLEGRVVTLDLAFAAGDRYETATRPFIEELGLRLAKWIDHHPHPAWSRYEGDPRFLLVDKVAAPACPQLVTTELVEEIGEVARIYAHADFDGLISAVKYLRGGIAPYPEADEDSRAIDAPGQGFVCSERGLRLARAIERSRDAHPNQHGAFAISVAEALVSGKEPAELTATIDRLDAEARKRQAGVRKYLDQAELDHPGILVLRLGKLISPSDKKNLLRELEERATIAVIEEPSAVTVATFDTRLRLNDVPGLHGTEGFAWGKARYHELREALIALLESR
ncbi:hypothetical protein [Vulgatibacter incomptus]|uniref:Uncharacterized protein n=1 Tax=Vulgatibacter incomptus TaxID=1391653 RepID=A0A0K1PHP2_9BACT|nr:hypothetical protein [Vulgatibacter incomptus]AKU93040.1 hypothetical protein AKJ08_3427 [Vulgatibacter incomptus]